MNLRSCFVVWRYFILSLHSFLFPLGHVHTHTHTHTHTYIHTHTHTHTYMHVHARTRTHIHTSSSPSSFALGFLDHPPDLSLACFFLTPCLSPPPSSIPTAEEQEYVTQRRTLAHLCTPSMPCKYLHFLRCTAHPRERTRNYKHSSFRAIKTFSLSLSLLDFKSTS